MDETLKLLRFPSVDDDWYASFQPLAGANFTESLAGNITENVPESTSRWCHEDNHSEFRQQRQSQGKCHGKQLEGKLNGGDFAEREIAEVHWEYIK